jgi:hypothetical protein
MAHSTTLQRGQKLWSNRALGAIVTIALATACILLTIYGSQMQAAAEAEQARIIDMENETVCGELGITRNGPRFAACAAALNMVRVRALERSSLGSVL